MSRRRNPHLGPSSTAGASAALSPTERAANISFQDSLLIFGSIIGALAALYALLGAVRNHLRETIGRRADRYARLARLGTGAQLSFFASVLGEPPAMQRTIVKADYVELVHSSDPDFDPHADARETQERFVERSFIESTFIDRDYYVQAISDDDETVLAFSVTTARSASDPSSRCCALLGRSSACAGALRPATDTVPL